MHPALEAIRNATQGTEFEGDLWIVGGAVRDGLLGLPHENDFDLVTRGSSAVLAKLLRQKRVSAIPPVTYERFGTAMVMVEGASVEIVTARKESYSEESRKPDVEPATLEEDAKRRDFTVNALMRRLHGGDLYDPLGMGLRDLEDKVLRTPLEPKATFHDDPLRMLRAVRFRWKLRFEPAPGLYEGIREEAHRLEIISMERIHDELVKMLELPTAPNCLQDLMHLEIIKQFAPEFVPLVGLEQGEYHHLDGWDHTLAVLQGVGASDLVLSLAALFHDIGKPQTRTVEDGRTRFLGHENVSEEIARKVLRRLKFSSDEIDQVALLVRNHGRLPGMDQLSPSAARRLVRDMGSQLDRLLALVDADRRAHKPGKQKTDMPQIRERIEQTRMATPAEVLTSPLEGGEIMELLGIPAGPDVGKWKGFLAEKVIEGVLTAGDKDAARNLLSDVAKKPASPPG